MCLIMAFPEKSEIVLSDKNPLSQGMERECYIHPADPGFVVKLPLRSKGDKCQANEDELRGYQLLKNDKVSLDFISHCHGYIATDIGKGLLCDCIRDDDGEVSKTLWDIVIYQDDCDIEYITEIIKKFSTFLNDHHVWIFDLNLKNIALKKYANGTYKPHIIDLKGRAASTEFIPVSRFIPYFSKTKLSRRSRQLLQRITDYHQRRDELRHSANN